MLRYLLLAMTFSLFSFANIPPNTYSLPLQQTQTTTYDTQGRVASKTDFNGQTSTYTYDINDRITSIGYADGSVDTFSYDVQGRIKSVSVTDAQGTTQTTNYTYDTMGRLTLETQPTGATLEYSYDNAGNLLTLTATNALGDTSTTTYTYDSLNRLSTVTANTGEVTSYSYDAVGNQTAITHHNGNTATYTYDRLNRLTNITHQNTQGTTLASFSYTLSPTGERTQITQLSKTTNYTYDDLGRLTDESIIDSTNGNYTASYTYDAVSNRIQSIIDGVTTQYTYDDNDRLTQQGGTTYSYDDNGNTLTETLDTNTTSYTYNSKNQLIKSINPTQTITYTYDSNGIRTSKTVNNKTTQYLVDSNQPYAQVLQELENNTLAVSYTYGSDLISQNRNNQTTTYHYDGLGSARYLSDSLGAFTDSYNYEAFGKLLQQEGNTTNHYKYTGEQQDEESKQYYLRARYYAPTTGRFTQQDTYMGSSADPVSLHKYLYASANPQTYTDPTGHFSMLETTAAMGVANTLRNMQIETYFNIGDMMTSQGSNDFSGLPAIAATGVGVSLLMRFTPKLFKFFKAYKSPGYSTWSHIYNPKIASGTVKGFHHAPMGIVPSKIHPIRKHSNKQGFYRLDFKMSPQFGADPRKKSRYDTKTMFPEEWSSSYVRQIVNKGYIKALLKGKGNDIQIPLSDILGSNYNGIYLQYYMKRASGQPYVHPVIK